MRGEHRDDQRAIQQRRGLFRADAFGCEALQGVRDFVRGAADGGLSILGQVREHGEQHEPADEGQRVIQAQGVEPSIDRARAGDAAVAIDRAAANVFDALEQRGAAVRTDDVTEQFSQVADVRVLRDRSRHDSL
jgi:hypothetical protein